MRFTVFLSLLMAFACQAGTLEGRVVGVSDGDTLTLLDSSKVQHKIRLAAVDAPEHGQPFGSRAKQSLSDLVFGKSVVVETHKLDRYGRAVGKVHVDGLDANLEQIRRGMAWHYKEYEREQSVSDRLLYSDAQGAARAARLGLWLDREPTPPWVWRKERRGD